MLSTEPPASNGSTAPSGGAANGHLSLNDLWSRTSLSFRERHLAKFVWPADTAPRTEDGRGDERQLHALVLAAADEARPYVSGFKVGAVGRGTSGKLYIGVNMELPGLPLNASIHAEQCLIANMVLHGEQGVTEICISQAPCGHCRQFMAELACADDVQISYAPKLAPCRLKDLLPDRFGPHSLLRQGPFPLLLQPQAHNLEFTAEAESMMQAIGGVIAAPAAAAISAARSSYSPYTRCPAGVAVVTGNGGIHAGFCMESAAHNPGMLPLQAALVAALVYGGLPDYEAITTVVLAERVDPLAVQYASVTRAATAAIAPQAKFYCLPVAYAQPMPLPKS